MLNNDNNILYGLIRAVLPINYCLLQGPSYKMLPTKVFICSFFTCGTTFVWNHTCELPLKFAVAKYLGLKSSLMSKPSYCGFTNKSI